MLRSKWNAIAALAFTCAWCACSSDSKTSANGGTGGGPNGMPTTQTTVDAAAPPTPLPTGAAVSVVHGVQTALPALPEFTNVTGTVTGDSAQVTFDPVDGALDYRIYPLPKDADIVAASNPIAIKNATYRCAGNIEKSTVTSDDGKYSPAPPSLDVERTSIESNVEGYTRTADTAVLGYVYPEAADGLLPVYAVGNPDPDADGTCLWGGYNVTRMKTYTSSKDEHDSLVAKGWRDDGIQFYVPAMGAAGTQVVSKATTGPSGNSFTVLYFADAAEAAARAQMNPAPTNFSVLTAPAPKTQPLMRFHYAQQCLRGTHDELVVGKQRFDNLYHQGNYAMAALLWAGLPQTADGTILVVEALSSGCPYQGMLAGSHIDATDTHIGTTTFHHEPYVTLDEMRAASTNGEVFVNGQFDTSTRPKAIARTFVKATYQSPPKMDFWEGFETDPGFAPATPTFGVSCSSMKHFTSSKFELSAYCTDAESTSLLAVGSFLGQFWDTFSDNAQDTAGKVRIQPKQTATLAADSFLHATMLIDSMSTTRRYPQILISDQVYPVQENMAKGSTVVFQSRGGWPPELEIQFCDHVMWDVNAQCPHYALFRADDKDTSPIPPISLPGEHQATDRSNQYDVFVSTKRAYFFYDGQPYGCANLPAGKLTAGPESVTFGDVLYHSGVDVLDSQVNWIYGFHVRHLAVETRRHYDNLGFSSSVPAPTWNEQNIPCKDTLIPE